MFLGIEIGGTKLQLGVGHGNGGQLVDLVRRDIDARRGAAGILAQIEQAGAELKSRHVLQRIGIGFGGPVDALGGRVIKSHQVSGWDDAPLVEWCQRTLELPTVIANDCDAAAIAEARFGAGRGAQRGRPRRPAAAPQPGAEQVRHRGADARAPTGRCP